MRFLNEGQSDRAVRMLAGLALVAAGWTLAINAFSVTLFVIGAIAFGTGHRRVVSGVHAVREFYVKTPAGHHSNCDTVL